MIISGITVITFACTSIYWYSWVVFSCYIITGMFWQLLQLS